MGKHTTPYEERSIKDLTPTHILAIVLVPPPEDGKAVDPWQIQDLERPYGLALKGCRVHYVRKPFSKEPDFNATSVNYKLDQLLANAEAPS